MTNLFDSLRAAVGRAEDDAQREYRELGVSLRIANEERKRLEERYAAAIDLLAAALNGNRELAMRRIEQRVAINRRRS